MKRINATSRKAVLASEMLTNVQQKFVAILENVNKTAGFEGKFSSIEWFRNEGKFGGGTRYTAPKNEFFNGASVNFSQIQYESEHDKALRSATAISTIVHPKNPKAPSFHMHVSLTEMKNGESYWRIMADLNPSIVNLNDKQSFETALRAGASNYYAEGSNQGDRYFYIPSLKRHRGVSHFYLENFKDETLAEPFAKGMIESYGEILKNYRIEKTFSDEDLNEQLTYHTLYFYQVLTMDRGTTSGLLVHNENDIGILASLPSHIDKELMHSWKEKTVFPQSELVDRLVSVLPKENKCKITDEVKGELANQVREHYKKHPKALELQAAGNVIPPTVQNHK